MQTKLSDFNKYIRSVPIDMKAGPALYAHDDWQSILLEHKLGASAIDGFVLFNSFVKSIW